MVGAHAFEVARHWEDEVVEVCTPNRFLSIYGANKRLTLTP